MSFSTLFFVFTWLPCVLLIYFITPKKYKNYVLLVASLLFYAWGEPTYLFLLILLIVLNYIFGIYLGRKIKGRKLFFIEVLIFNIFILFYFKYYAFTLESIFSITNTTMAFNVFDMPLGVSFFMFTLLSYVVDVYRGKIKAEKNFMHFALYVSFFPKLVMGPIVSYQEMKDQIKHHPTTSLLLNNGAKSFVVGLAQKVILANTFASVFAQLQSEPLTMVGSWLMAITYTLQLYFDFNGYTKMAIGLGNIFGFTLPENFNYPYMATSIKDFWSRWHITLSHFFRDYVYIPLGGNRVPRYRHIINILVVWMLTGIWHGANYTFIAWGLYYGILLLLEKYVFAKLLKGLSLTLRHVLTMLLVMIGWILFFSEDINQAFAIIGNLVNITNFANGTVFFYLRTYFIYFVVGIIGVTPLIRNVNIYCNQKYNQVFYIVNMVGVFLLLFLSIAFMISSTYQSFLYFAF